MTTEKRAVPCVPGVPANVHAGSRGNHSSEALVPSVPKGSGGPGLGTPGTPVQKSVVPESASIHAAGTPGTPGTSKKQKAGGKTAKTRKPDTTNAQRQRRHRQRQAQLIKSLKEQLASANGKGFVDSMTMQQAMKRMDTAALRSEQELQDLKAGLDELLDQVAAIGRALDAATGRLSPAGRNTVLRALEVTQLAQLRERAAHSQTERQAKRLAKQARVDEKRRGAEWVGDTLFIGAGSGR